MSDRLSLEEVNKQFTGAILALREYRTQDIKSLSNEEFEETFDVPRKKFKIADLESAQEFYVNVHSGKLYTVCTDMNESFFEYLSEMVTWNGSEWNADGEDAEDE